MFMIGICSSAPITASTKPSIETKIRTQMTFCIIDLLHEMRPLPVRSRC
jgi:hypothetical protein